MEVNMNPFKLAEKSHRTPKEIWEYLRMLQRDHISHGESDG